MLVKGNLNDESSYRDSSICSVPKVKSSDPKSRVATLRLATCTISVVSQPTVNGSSTAHLIRPSELPPAPSTRVGARCTSRLFQHTRAVRPLTRIVHWRREASGAAQRARHPSAPDARWLACPLEAHVSQEEPSRPNRRRRRLFGRRAETGTREERCCELAPIQDVGARSRESGA